MALCKEDSWHMLVENKYYASCKTWVNGRKEYEVNKRVLDVHVICSYTLWLQTEWPSRHSEGIIFETGLSTLLREWRPTISSIQNTSMQYLQKYYCYTCCFKVYRNTCLLGRQLKNYNATPPNYLVGLTVDRTL